MTDKLTKIKIIRNETAKKYFDGVCFVCKKSIHKGFNFHHIGYRINEKKHSDFKSWVEYNEYVLPIIQKLPEKFALLCHKCHRLVSILQLIKNGDRFERVVDLTRKSRR